MEDLEKVTYFAETDHRKKTPFGVKAVDRGKHIYVIGKTGMGKSTLLENMAVQDIQNGNGLCFVDPHGKTAELLLEYVPEDRIDDVIYFAPFDMENPMSFNIMEDVGYDKRHLVANGLMSAFKKIWVDMWSARMEYILNNVILALLEYPDSTLLGVNRMLTDKVYRKKVVDNVTDPSTKSFWVDEFAKYTDRYTMEATPAIQNKVGQFTANPLIRNIIGQPKSSFNFRDAMDQKKIIIINLSKGRIGEGNANLLGSMLITKLYLSAMSRADLSDQELGRVPNFYLFVDEFQSFANESFADILSEARKYKLNLTIAHQYIEQMP
ncbi:MAG: type IV secretion system DNA-binding domain-containing protein, partial [Candidatus Pacebacteria bacterium]|nr:type IV secretion system DNA-binding domain-containing protein [Candidatus Paceibacterota bacterium]